MKKNGYEKEYFKINKELLPDFMDDEPEPTNEGKKFKPKLDANCLSDEDFERLTKNAMQ